MLHKTSLLAIDNDGGALFTDTEMTACHYLIYEHQTGRERGRERGTLTARSLATYYCLPSVLHGGIWSVQDLPTAQLPPPANITP
jgi:hypothetical protein